MLWRFLVKNVLCRAGGFDHSPWWVVVLSTWNFRNEKISHRTKTGPCCAIPAVTEASSDLFLLWSSAAFQHHNGFGGELWILPSWEALLSPLTFHEIFWGAPLLVMLRVCSCIISRGLAVSHYWISAFILHTFLFLQHFIWTASLLTFVSSAGIAEVVLFGFGGFLLLLLFPWAPSDLNAIIIPGLCIETTTCGWVSSEDGRALWMCTLHSQSSQGLFLPSSL